VKPCRIVWGREYLATFFWAEKQPCIFIPASFCRKVEGGEVQVAVRTEPWIVAWYEARLLFSEWKGRQLVGDIEELQEKEEHSNGNLWIAPMRVAKKISVPYKLSELDLNEIHQTEWEHRRTGIGKEWKDEANNLRSM
jgi:hypothetical protein